MSHRLDGLIVVRQLGIIPVLADQLSASQFLRTQNPLFSPFLTFLALMRTPDPLFTHFRVKIGGFCSNNGCCVRQLSKTIRFNGISDLVSAS